MRNSFSVIILVAMTLSAASCMKINGTSSSYEIRADFENALYSSAGASFEKDSTFAAAYMFLDQGTTFLCSYVKDGLFSSGWKLSYKKGHLDKDGTLNPFSSYGEKAGASNSQVYAVYHPADDEEHELKYDIFFDFPARGTCTNVLGSLDINNSGAMQDFISSKQIIEGQDYMKVIIEAYANEVKVGSVETMLVDYREEVPKVVTEWKTVNLTTLPSNTNGLKFKVESSRPQLPRYFCMDNFTTKLSIHY